MNIEAYNLDSLRQLVRALQEENRSLKELLKSNGITYEESDIFTASSSTRDEFDPDQASRITPISVTDDTARKFYGMFWGRTDVFAKRGAKGRYYPQCENRWNNSVCPKTRGAKTFCDSCESRKWKPLELNHIKQHLIGAREDCADVIGTYPLLPDGTCRFLVFDFDNHEKGADLKDNANTDEIWRDEVNALRRICQKNDIDALVERSRSGRGAHVWIFFKGAISASLARNFGFSLLDRGCEEINMTSFRFYDRMYPSQDSSDGIGNLVALPLQGRALLNGNSAFVDDDWNAYPDQMETLFHTKRLTKEEIEHNLIKWTQQRTGNFISTDAAFGRELRKPWKRNDVFRTEDVVGKLHIVLSDGIYIDTLNIAPRIQNQIRCLAVIDNPEFYKRKIAGRSNYYYLSTIYLGKDIDGYIQIPRGIIEDLIRRCNEAGIEFEIEDFRSTGRPLRVRFNGELRTQQDLAAEKLLSTSGGILSAATAFGKTVVCSYMIAQRKVSTLILLESTELIDQWANELRKFIILDENPPEYLTKTGRKKKRKDVIGTLSAGQDKTTGIIDIAMIGSAANNEAFLSRLDAYGMVIMDECHHAASRQAQEVLRRVKSKYLYGVSATPVRSDKLEKINYMLLGPIRHKYSAKEHARAQGIDLFVYPRFTRVVSLGSSLTDFHKAVELISESEDRNLQIINDIIACIENSRTPVILTRLKKHAKLIYDKLIDKADHVFLLYGDNSQSQNREIREKILNVPAEDSMIIIATGQKIGEGFDCPRLDTLMLASPVKFDGRLTQYVGRLNRSYKDKTSVIVYDYVDSHISIFDKQYSSRLTAYKKLGYKIISELNREKQTVNSIYDKGNYAEVFERDLVEANSEIVISSPGLLLRKVQRMISILKPRQETGVSITVITSDPDISLFYNSDELCEIIELMRNSGINVLLSREENEHYAVIDKKLVWHGGMNLLGKEDVWDNLIRVENASVAAELMELSHRSGML